ncbi:MULTISPECIES: hypothetical protein [unclassified Nocardioides]|uniref:hypothetical protein n=1 Tax=unclassified Nocardioides TaxID=2615069 RepID=UPI003014A4C2
MTDKLEGLDIEALTNHPTRLRAAAATYALLIAGERPSVSRVANLVGVTRQNIHKSHEPVAELIKRLRSEWTPKPNGATADLIQQRDAAVADAARERRKRKTAEAERDRVMHHLELCDATLQELARRNPGVRNLLSLPTRATDHPEPE